MNYYYIIKIYLSFYELDINDIKLYKYNYFYIL